MDEDAFQSRLLPGERIAWTGRPAAGLLFSPRDIFLIPFSLLWCGFAIFWEFTAMANSKAPAFFDLWGMAFVLIGLYFVAGRFLTDALVRNKTYYAVTNQRILLLRVRPFSKFTSLAIDRLPELSLDERSDGRGTIRFQTAQGFGGRGFSGWSPALDATPQFLMIAQARDVFNRIQKMASVRPG